MIHQRASFLIPKVCFSLLSTLTIFLLVFFLADVTQAMISPWVKVQSEFTPQGLQAIMVDGQAVLTSGRFQLTRVRLTDQFRNKNVEPFAKQLDISPEKDPYAGDKRTFRDGNTTPVTERFNQKKKVLQQVFDWGSINVSYRTQADRLDLVVQIHNTSKAVIEQISADLLTLTLPGEIDKPQVVSSQPDWAREDANIGAPLVLKAEYPNGILVVTSAAPGGPLKYELSNGPQGSLILRSILGNEGGSGEVYDGRWNVRPIKPGKTDKFLVSLRFGRPDADVTSMTKDAATAFRLKHPFRLNWADRRPIGAVHVADGRVSAANPRGWKHAANIPENWDILTDTNYSIFRENLLKGADNIVNVAHREGMQGIIVWQIEGQEFGNAAFYGEPRLVKWIAPEMDFAADDFFARLRAGGLRVGICIRPPIYKPVDAQGNRTNWKDVKNIVGIDWTHPSQQDAFHQSFDTIFELREAQSPLERLDAKIRYAQQRWGCTLFYIDTNHFSRPRDRSQRDWAWTSKMISAETFEELQRRHPDVLLIPEHEYVQYWSSTAPYLQPPDYGRFTDSDVRAIYPDAFSVIFNSTGAAYIKANESTFVQAITNGDIMASAGWYSDDETVQLYRKSAQLAPYHLWIPKDGVMLIQHNTFREMTMSTSTGKTLTSQYQTIGKAKTLTQLANMMKKALARATTVPERRVWVTYNSGVTMQQLNKAIDVIGKAHGIIAWTNEDSQ